MIAIDTNILIYAHRSDSPWHAAATRCLTRLAGSGRAWAIPWPCLHEFLAIATHPRVLSPPTPLTDAIRAVESWMHAPTLRMLGETDGHFRLLRQLLERARVLGPVVHDARIAALCLQHGVSELWSADRDFSRFHGLRVRNPLVLEESP
jgi:toxin-antitoxin system PIN domain toxin